MVWILLAIAVAAEVAATTAMVISDGFTRLWPSIAVVVGYSISFWLFAIVLRQLNVGVVYAIWSGLGTAGIAAVGVVAFNQRIDAWGYAGIGMILAGVVVLNTLSGSLRH